MSARRVLEVARRELHFHAGRPLIWVLIVVVGLFAWGLSDGSVQISTGDSDTGGQKAWMTSEFAMARTLAVLVLLVYGFFVSVGAGMIVIRDDEEKVGELLHSTPLSTREYVWGKWLAAVAAFLGVLAIELGLHALFQHALSGADEAEFVGPFELSNYARPAVVFAVPPIVLVAGVSFALGTWTRKAIPVFFLPAALLLVCAFFLWTWDPTWLRSDMPALDSALAWIDPTGFRWLNRTWTEVDRGVEFYNEQSIGLDPPFVASRLAMVALGLLAVAAAERRFASTLRGTNARPGKASSLLENDPFLVATRSALASARAIARDVAGRPGEVALEPSGTSGLSELAMTSRVPGLFRGILEVARVELRELRSQPGLYLFVPLILLQTIGTAMSRVGPLDTPMLSTSGLLAADGFNTLSLLVCLLLAFYTVESLERERARGLAPVYYATPIRSASILFGKGLANSLVGAAILGAAFLACVVVLLVQGKASVDLAPFALLWGLLLVPTFFVWTSFVSAVYSLSRNRYAGYAAALAMLAFSGYRQFRGYTTWAGNWNLWGTVSWSDLGPLELDRAAFLLNRAYFLTVGVALTAFAVRMFPRRALDPSSVLLRLRPGQLLRSLLGFSGYLVAPCVLGALLLDAVESGTGGADREKLDKDYWRKNVATWTDVEDPSISDLEVELELDPPRSSMRVDGRFVLVNDEPEPMRRFALTPGAHFEDLEWTLAGEKYEPDERSGLAVFTPESALAPGATVEVGFRFHGRFPGGISKNGGGAMEFVLPSGVVLTSFTPSFVPVVGFVESRGVDEDNRYDARDFADDFHLGRTRSIFGNDASMTSRITVRVPEEYLANSVGELESETVADGIRTAVWRSDYPVEFVNVICGKWEVARGDGTSLFHHRGHAYNVAEILEALEGARKHYSEWFLPYPWKELKVSEFAAHATYAQGFPTNITFSEGIGFLAKSDPRAPVAFGVAAHEAAHQWWGNLLVPGEGPGGNLLSEGMANFSTVLLIERVRGLRERIAFCKGMESRYGRSRQVDSEKPLVRVDGSRPGDTTVTYDKGGWTFWMLHRLLGPERSFAALQAFLREYHHSEDHPLLQDFVETVAEFAPDRAAYDEFVRQWFLAVVVPEYRIENAAKKQLEDGTWEVTARITNIGTGRMPIEVCAARGERFADADSGPGELAGGVRAAATPVHAEARIELDLGAGEGADVRVLCDFEPERVLVDPDALVLQARRESATADL
jgi:ABC-2 type transport system permease protein